MSPGPGMRAMRAAVFTAVCVLLSAGAHVRAGGAPPAHAVVLLAIALTFAGAYALAGRERTLRVLLPAAFAGQYGLHHLFAWGAEVAEASAVHQAHATAGHQHASAPVIMALAHLIAAVLTAAWLDRGEAALCSLVRRVCERAARRLPLLIVLRPPALALGAASACPVAIPVTRILATAIARRGPPAPISC